MGVHYLVDFENVHENGLYGMYELSAEDCVYIFHTSCSDKISLGCLDDVQAWVKVILVPPGKQSLDMHLGSFLGYLIGKEQDPETRYAIVSKDADYRGIAYFWNQTYRMCNKVQIIQGVSFSDEFRKMAAGSPFSDDPADHAVIHDFIIRVFSKHSVAGRNGMPCMLVSDLCTCLNSLAQYNKARKRLGKKPMQYLCDEHPDLLMVKKQSGVDWVYLLSGKNDGIPAGDPAEWLADAAVENFLPEITEPDGIGTDDLNIAAAPAVSEGSDESVIQADTVQDGSQSSESGFLSAAVDFIQEADSAGGRVRASSLRDHLLALPEFRTALKESGIKPIPFMRQLFAEKIRIDREKGIFWAEMVVPREEEKSAAEESTEAESEDDGFAKLRRRFYEQAFSNIRKQLSGAGLDQEITDEIAEIYMRSNTAVEPRKMIHTLLCQRFGAKAGARYYRKAAKYINF